MDKVERFGFIKNDALALKMGIPKDSKTRLIALISYVLKDTLYQLGNSYITKSDLFAATNKFLKDTTIEYDFFIDVLNDLKNEKVIFESNEGLIFDYNLYEKEKKLAEFIAKKLTSCKLDYSNNQIEKAFQFTSYFSEVLQTCH